MGAAAGSAMRSSSCACMPVMGVRNWCAVFAMNCCWDCTAAAQHQKQPVERYDDGGDLARHGDLIDRPQVEGGALGDLVAQAPHRPQSQLDADPNQHQRDVELHEIPQQGAHQAKAGRRLGGGSNVRHREDDDARAGVESGREDAHVAPVDLRQGKHLGRGVGHRHQREPGIAEQQAPLRVAHRVGDGVGSGQGRLAASAGVERHLIGLDLQARHQGVCGFLQPAVAADHSRRNTAEVVHQCAAQRQQHERHRQPEHQLAADRRAHVLFASSNRYPRPRRLRITTALPSLARNLDMCTSTAFGVMSCSGPARACCTLSFETI